MKHKLFRMIAVTIVLMSLLSVVTSNASAKLSEYDFSSWNLKAEETTFSGLSKDDEVVQDDFSENWIYNHVAGNKGIIEEADGKKLFKSTGFNQLYLVDPITDKYTYSIDFKCPKNQNVGFFVRAGVERFPMEANISDFYEQDRSAIPGEGDSLGGSGIYVKPNGNQMKLYIKLYDESKKCSISNAIYNIDAGVDFDTSIQKLTFVDDGASVLIYVGDALKAKVAFSESGTYDSIGTEDYFKKAVVTDAAGTELGTHANAIISTASVVAVGNRNNTVYLEKITLSVSVPPATPTPEPTSTPEPTPTPTPTKAPTETPETNKGGNSNSKWIIISIVAVVVVVAIVAMIIIKKKK